MNVGISIVILPLLTIYISCNIEYGIFKQSI